MMKFKMIKKISIKTKLGWGSAFENNGKIFKRCSSWKDVYNKLWNERSSYQYWSERKSRNTRC